MFNFPARGCQWVDENVGSTSAEPGTTITAGGTAHEKGSWTQLLASTAYEVYGITVLIAGTGTTASTNMRWLCDIGWGSSGSEEVFIPNLIGGNTPAMNSGVGPGTMYHFPIYIPAGTRLSARAQSSTASRTATVAIWLHEWPNGPLPWIGSKVTAYGIDTAASTGVIHTCGNSSYPTSSQITASTSDAIRYMQVGIDMGTDSTASSARGLMRIGISTATVVVNDLPWTESTTLETVCNVPVNLILSQMRFNLASGIRLYVQAMRNVAGEGRGFAIYGVS